MNISENGKKLIKSFEGIRLKAYKVISSEKYFTIGYGHYGQDVLPNMVITEAQANKLFDEDIKKYVDAVNNAKLTFTPNQNQFDALTSFCYNLGTGIMNDFKNLSPVQVANEMILYVNSGGTKLEGLVKRRRKEIELFNTKVNKPEVKPGEIITKEYREIGRFTCTVDKIYFRNKPIIENSNKIQGDYSKGESVNYDKVVITNKYVYISWTSLTGIRRYMPVRDLIDKEVWGTFK